MKKINKTDSLGQIVAVFPGAGDHFMNHHIDFCCGGERSLEIALIEKKIEIESFVEELNQRYAIFQNEEVQYQNWAEQDPESLINHILKEHHQFLRDEMPKISTLLFTLLSVHGKKHRELFEIHRKFSLLRMELESHLIKEEMDLFPGILAYTKNPTETSLQNLEKLNEEIEAEHIGAGDLLKGLREDTDHYSVPNDGCTTYRLVFAKLQALEKNTFEHIHLENNILLKNF